MPPGGKGTMILSSSIRFRTLLLGIAATAVLSAPARPQVLAPPRALRVQISVNHPNLVYREGDTLRVSVTANKNCYLRLMYCEASGKDVVIFPNYQDMDDKVQGGVEYVIPTKFQITQPLGSEALHAFVSSEKFSTLDGLDRGDGLIVLKEPIERVLTKLRSGGIFGEYAEQRLEIITRAKEVAASEAPQIKPPWIELVQPGPSDFLVDQRDTVTIEGLVTGDDLVTPVLINGKPVQTEKISSGLQFSLSVGLVVGENTFEVVARNAHHQTTTKSLVVKRAENRFAGKRWAVVIGISEYKHPEIHDLKYAHRDAEAFYEFLKSANGGAFADDHTLLLTDAKATKANVRSAVFDFLKQTSEEDLVMIYFSGHGLSRGKGYSYFVTHDSDPYRMEETAFDMEDIQAALRKTIQAERVVIFADACYSGAINDYVKGTRTTQLEENLINRYLSEMAKAKPGIVSVTSCAENEVSGEAWLFWEHGVFTFVLISGLGGKITDTEGRVKTFESADADGDGIVTVSELTQYVTKYVPGYTKNKQNPQVSKSNFDPNTPLSVIR